MLVVVSRAGALERRYGTEGFRAVRAELYRFAENSRPPARVWFADQRTERSPGAELSSGIGMRVALRSMITENAEVSGLLLVGGDDVVPFCRVINPVRDRTVDPDVEVLTDNPYGLGPDDTLSGELDALLEPTIPVGRLPDEDPPRLGPFLDQIKNLSAPTPHDRTGTFAAVDAAWHDVPASVLEGSNPTLRMSPGWHSGEAEWRGMRPRISYFNLHGFEDHPHWRAYDSRRNRWTVAMRPTDITKDESSGAVVFAENCYGAHVRGRSARNCVALAFLAAESRAFVGATGTAFSSIAPGLETVLLRNADQLAKKFLHNVSVKRMAFGRALVEARRSLAEQLRSPPGRTTFGLKTALQFVLYGNPLAAL